MTEDKERKNKQIALLSTIGVHTIILLIMFFVIAWRAPDPPLGELGVNLNFGLDTEGSGDIQPTEPVGSNQVATTEKAENLKTEEKQTEEKQKEVTPQETVKPKEVQPDKDILTSNDQESPVVIKEKKDVDKPVEKPVDKPKPKEDKPIAVYKPATDTKTDSDKSGEREGKSGSQGDDLNKKGDKGDPRGTVDGQAMYGKPGGGGGGGNGPALDLYGWEWDEIPKPDVPDSETGRIVFLIEVDEDGGLKGYKKESSSVSIATERACIAAIEKLTFTKKSGAKVPPVSKGRITFVVRSR